jgi:hypothetical protein
MFQTATGRGTRSEEMAEESARQIGRHVLMRLAMINNLPVTTLPSHDQFAVNWPLDECRAAVYESNRSL